MQQLNFLGLSVKSVIYFSKNIITVMA